MPIHVSSIVYTCVCVHGVCVCACACACACGGDFTWGFPLRWPTARSHNEISDMFQWSPAGPAGRNDVKQLRGLVCRPSCAVFHSLFYPTMEPLHGLCEVRDGTVCLVSLTCSSLASVGCLPLRVEFYPVRMRKG